MHLVDLWRWRNKLRGALGGVGLVPRGFCIRRFQWRGLLLSDYRDRGRNWNSGVGLEGSNVLDYANWR